MSLTPLDIRKMTFGRKLRVSTRRRWRNSSSWSPRS